jgi:hypothetical protein
MEEIFRSDVAVVTREPGFIRLRRTSLALAAAPPNVTLDFVSSFRFVVPLRERRNLGFLLDSRDAPIISDDAMFMAMQPMMADMVQGFARVSILVQTALGKLQATRRARSSNMFGSLEVVVFGDEAEAIAYVTGRSK